MMDVRHHDLTHPELLTKKYIYSPHKGLRTFVEAYASFEKVIMPSQQKGQAVGSRPSLIPRSSNGRTAHIAGSMQQQGEDSRAQKRQKRNCLFRSRLLELGTLFDLYTVSDSAQRCVEPRRMYATVTQHIQVS